MSTPKIEIYTQYGCPYCVRAKALLTAKGVAFTEIDVTMDAALRRQMEARQHAPSLRAVNPEVSWGLDAIARKCLDPLPERRYRRSEEPLDVEPLDDGEPLPRGRRDLNDPW